MKRLGPNVRLESTAAGPLLRYLPRPGLDDLPPLPLHPLLALALARLDRGESVEAIGADLGARLGSPFEAMREIVADAQICFQAHFKNGNGASYVDLGDLDALTESLAVPGTVYRSRDVVFPRDRALFPLTLQWLVTRYCNRQCVYCYAGADAGAAAKDAELTGGRMRQILLQAARLGTCNFMLTGGEPLLRDDIYELIADSLALGITPEIISKQFIPAEAVSRLAEAGMPRIYLSIDSLDPELARRMTGVRGFAERISETILRLVAAGITVGAKAVVTAANIDDIPATAARLEALGVTFYGLVIYERNLQRHSDALMPSHESLLRLRDWKEAFAAAKHDLDVSFTYEAEKPRALGPDRFVCHNG
ncbi:MAG TPA: radical SAM protein, partial [Thermoanaerobaculia bacterium]|nr:radical SAM protein [Thermoanaerobaculia bacterium]